MPYKWVVTLCSGSFSVARFMQQASPSSLAERLAVWVVHGGGFALLLLFCSQQLSLLLGLVLLITGFALWSYWLVFFALLSLRGSFFLQSVHRATAHSAD